MKIICSLVLCLISMHCVGAPKQDLRDERWSPLLASAEWPLMNTHSLFGVPSSYAHGAGERIGILQLSKRWSLMGYKMTINEVSIGGAGVSYALTHNIALRFEGVDNRIVSTSVLGNRISGRYLGPNITVRF
jgi:hypothetical protein